MNLDFGSSSGNVMSMDPCSLTSFIEDIQPIGLFQLSADLCWINLSAKAAGYLGYSKTGWVHWDSVITSLEGQWRDAIATAYHSIKNQKANYYSKVEIQTGTGKEHIFELWLKRQTDGTVFAALKDVTDNVFTEGTLSIVAKTQKAAGTFNFHYRFTKNSFLLSESFFSLFGVPYTDRSLSFETFRSFLDVDDLLKLDLFFNALVQEKQTAPKEFIFNFLTWNREVRKIKIVAFLQIDEKGYPAGILGKGIDVTILAESEAIARHNQELLSIMVEEAPDAVALLNTTDFSVEKINKRWAEIFAIQAHQVDGMKLALGEYLLFLYNQNTVQTFIEGIKSGFIAPSEEVLMHTFDGRQIWTRVNLAITHLLDKELLLVRILDIHEAKVAGIKIKESEKRYRLLFDENPYPLFVVEKNTHKFLEVNNAAVRHYGYSKDEFLELIYNDILSESITEIAEYSNLDSGTINALGDSVIVHKTKEGRLLYVNTATYDLPAIGHLATEGQLMLIHDLTEIIKTHNELTYQQLFLKKVIDTDRNLIFVKDRQGVFQIANKAICDVFELEAHQVIGRSDYDINGHNSRTDKYLEDDKRVLDTGIPFLGEDVYVHPKTGAEYYLLTYKSRIFAPDGEPLVLCVCTDLTAQRKYEKELEKSEMLFRSIWDQSPDALFIVKNDGLNIIEDCNQTAVVLFGCDSKADLIGRDGPSLHVQEEHNLLNESEVDHTFKILNDTGFWAAQFKYRRNDGSIFWGNLAFTRVQYWKEDYILVRVTNIDGLRKVQEELSSSLKEKEILMKEIHHRVKNNMSVISGLLQLQSAYVEDKETVAAFRESQRRIRGMALIHEQLYQTEIFSEIDFSAYLKTLCSSLADTSAPENIELEVKSEGVLVDINLAVPLGLLVNEVITNAFKHAFKGRASGIVQVFCDSREGEYSLIISDNGIGVTDWGQPGFSKSLGVTLIKELSRQINAQLSVESKNGTTFAFRFKANPRKI